MDYPYQSNIVGSSSGKLYDGGVIILSRFPIVMQSEFVFPECNGADCYADKGVAYAEIVKGANSYHVFAAHTASFDSDEARENRLKQLQQIRNLADSLDIPANQKVIFGGDLNVDKLAFPGDYSQMLDILQVHAPVYSGYTKATFDPDINDNATDLASGSRKPQYLDYILQAKQAGQVSDDAMINTNEVFVLRSDVEDLWQVWDLSDHFPVRSTIR
jgi:endonuclease/exonuclease/phosphatase family metal-dependent hydrolase